MVARFPNEISSEALNEAILAAVRDLQPEELDGCLLTADTLLARDAANVVITLGAQGAFVKNARVAAHIPAFDAGPVLETTGAGDAFNGALVVGLSEELDLIEAARLGCAAAGISVTRLGTARAMPTRPEVEALLRAAGYG